MKAHDSYLTSLIKLSDAIFSIPVYQRNYDWDSDNCKQLFKDIEIVSETGKDHFIGSIVYISIGTATEPYYNIIDGQQRITSVMLFLKALHDSTSDDSLKHRIQFGFLTNIGLDGNPKMKLKQIESDRTIYEKLIIQSTFNLDDYSNDEQNSTVFKNYSLFKELISQSDVDLNSLYQAVFKLEIIDVCLTTEDPQEVFESMNSTGKSLTNTDLLRNYLLMDLPQSSQENLYKKYWSLIEKNVGTKQMDSFMVHYLIMKRKSDSINIRKKSAKINKNTLYESYKIVFTPEQKSITTTEELLSDMTHYSNIYRRIFSNPGESELDKSINELVIDLNAESVAVYLMYLLDYQNTHSVSDCDLLKGIKACISYVFRVRFFKGAVSPQFFGLAIQYFENNDSSVPFIDRIWDSLVKGAGSYRFPRDLEFQDAFQNKNMYLEFKPPMLRYILYKFEKERTKDVVTSDGSSIEHILPQDTKEWQLHLSDINDTKYYELIHKIGNLTLTKMNSEASNDPFEKKKQIYKKSGYFITRQIANFDDWRSIEIQNRSAEMANEAVSLWPLPSQYNHQSTSTIEAVSMSEDVEELLNACRLMIKDLGMSIYEDAKKWYINFVLGKRILFSLVPYPETLNATLNISINRLENPTDLVDISNKGHYGVGDCKLKITNLDSVELLKEYVIEIVNKQ